MINGKAILKFGDGSIMVTPLCNNHLEDNQLGAICFNQTEPGEINRKIPIINQAFSEEASVIMTFSKPESVDVVIEALTWIRNTMNNETPETDRIGWDKPFNLNILKEDEKMIGLMRKGLLSKTKRYAKIISAAPSKNKIDIRDFTTREEAELKSKKWTSWPYKVITRARDKNGRFTKGYVLICCK